MLNAYMQKNTHAWRTTRIYNRITAEHITNILNLWQTPVNKVYRMSHAVAKCIHIVAKCTHICVVIHCVVNANNSKKKQRTECDITM